MQSHSTCGCLFTVIYPVRLQLLHTAARTNASDCQHADPQISQFIVLQVWTWQEALVASNEYEIAVVLHLRLRVVYIPSRHGSAHTRSEEKRQQAEHVNEWT